MACGNYIRLLGENKYPLYVAIVMMLLFMCNQASRYILVATNVQMANEMHFGEKECRSSQVLSDETHGNEDMKCGNNPELCDAKTKSADCEWYYTGTGYEYQLLAGPLFNIIFSFTGVPIGIILERNQNNRKNVISLCAVLWSSMVVLGGLATQYWHLAVTRLGIAFFEAAFSAFAVSLIGSYFPTELRAMAMSIFMWGVYFGYSLAFVMKLVTNVMGWRQAYFMTGVPGILIGLLCYCTVTEPAVEHLEKTSIGGNGSAHKKITTTSKTMPKLAPAPLFNSLYIALILTAAIRCGGGYVFSYNIHNYMNYAYPGYPIENFLSWIPALTGVFGSLVGGVASDRIATHGGRGFTGRILVVVISTVLSIPCAIFILQWSPPWCFFILIPGYFFHEMWGGIVMTAVLEQAPMSQQTSAMAIYVFTINIIGGNMTLLVPFLRSIVGWKWSLYLLWPGSYFVSVLMLLWTLVLAKKRGFIVSRHKDDVARQPLFGEDEELAAF